MNYFLTPRLFKSHFRCFSKHEGWTHIHVKLCGQRLLHATPRPFSLFLSKTRLTDLWQMWGQLVPAILGEGRRCHHHQIYSALNSYLNSLNHQEGSFVFRLLCTSRCIWKVRLWFNLMFFLLKGISAIKLCLCVICPPGHC